MGGGRHQCTLTQCDPVKFLSGSTEGRDIFREGMMGQIAFIFSVCKLFFSFSPPGLFFFFFFSAELTFSCSVSELTRTLIT